MQCIARYPGPKGPGYLGMMPFSVEHAPRVPTTCVQLLTIVHILDDGSFHKSNQIIKLCTEGFMESDVDLLIQVLENKFNLECRKEGRGKGFRIVIKNKSLETLRELLCSHLHSSSPIVVNNGESMLYKLGL
jgi:hypothetical protein